MMQRYHCGDGMCVEMIFDSPRNSTKLKGNCIGIMFIPPAGGMEWHSVKGDWGQCNTEKEAINALKEAWGQ